MDIIGRRYIFITFESLGLTGTSGTLETVRKRMTSFINGVDY